MYYTLLNIKQHVLRSGKVTQFRVLPVRCGDAYSLQGSRGSYLVDGGVQGGALPEMLGDRRMKKLRAAMCSSVCPERLGGLLDLMDAGWPVTEYWLPDALEVLPELARRFNCDWNGWLVMLGLPESGDGVDNDGCRGDVALLPDDKSRCRLEGAALLIGLGTVACLGRSPYNNLSRRAIFCGNSVDPSLGVTRFLGKTLGILSDRAGARGRSQTPVVERVLRRAGWRLLSGGSLEDMALACCDFLHAESELMTGGKGNGLRTVIDGLILAARAATMMAKSTSRFRFFRQTGKREDHFVSRHPFKCHNGQEGSLLPQLASVSSPEMILKELERMGGRNEGLVFQYGDARCGALFCGDTKMNFLGKGHSVLLDCPTVVTAPGQGNSSFDSAYARIVSRDSSRDIWVRSHFSYARKVSDCFKEKEEKFCLNNCFHYAVHEIVLSYSDGRWNRETNGSCFCD
jgi:hypothetical protein